jgi:hypothetical protein
MLRLATSLALAALVATAPAWAGGRLTDKCRTSFDAGIILHVTEGAESAILAEVNSGRRSHTDLFTRLWEPVDASAMFIPPHYHYVVLDFMENQDLRQIMADLRSDPELAQLGVSYTEPNQLFCFAPPPGATPVVLTEFHNPQLDRYFLAPSPNARSSRGPREPAWIRTGEVVGTIVPDECYHTVPVFNFYNAATQTQVLTNDPAECGDLRREPRRWTYQGEAFGAMLPKDGQCASWSRPAWRLHDPRSPLSERLVWRPELRAQMVARGWIDDGLAFCLYGR